MDIFSMASHAGENVTYQQAQDLQRELERVSISHAASPNLSHPPNTIHSPYRHKVLAPPARMEH